MTTHNPTLRTDFASIMAPAVTTSVEGRGDTRNPRRDAAARSATTRRDAQADDDASVACHREIDFPDPRELRFEADPGECGGKVDLEGEPSPWEKRAAHRWKRRWVATDSSAEQSPEVSCSTRAVLTVSSGNGRRRRLQKPVCGVGESGPAPVGSTRCPLALQGRSRDAPLPAFGRWVGATRGQSQPACRQACAPVW
jgi:hypothetical protein